MRISSLIKLALIWVTDRVSRRNDQSEQIERVEGKLAVLPQVECPLTHRFAPGVYMRELTVPAGTLAIGHEHRTRHFNVILSGRGRVMIDGEVTHIQAPMVFVSEPGTRKILYVDEEIRWMTVHPTDETDLDVIERMCVRKSPTWLRAHEHDEARRLIGGVS